MNHHLVKYWTANFGYLLSLQYHYGALNSFIYLRISHDFDHLHLLIQHDKKWSPRSDVTVHDYDHSTFGASERVPSRQHIFTFETPENEVDNFAPPIDLHSQTAIPPHSVLTNNIDIDPIQHNQQSPSRRRILFAQIMKSLFSIVVIALAAFQLIIPSVDAGMFHVCVSIAAPIGLARFLVVVVVVVVVVFVVTLASAKV